MLVGCSESLAASLRHVHDNDPGLAVAAVGPLRSQDDLRDRLVSHMEHPMNRSRCSRNVTVPRMSPFPRPVGIIWSSVLIFHLVFAACESPESRRGSEAEHTEQLTGAGDPAGTSGSDEISDEPDEPASWRRQFQQARRLQTERGLEPGAPVLVTFDTVLARDPDSGDELGPVRPGIYPFDDADGGVLLADPFPEAFVPRDATTTVSHIGPSPATGRVTLPDGTASKGWHLPSLRVRAFAVVVPVHHTDNVAFVLAFETRDGRLYPTDRSDFVLLPVSGTYGLEYQPAAAGEPLKARVLSPTSDGSVSVGMIQVVLDGRRIASVEVRE